MSIGIRIVGTRGSFRLDVDLSMPINGVSALFGPSGSGKTSVLRALAGLDRYPGSVVRVGDMVWQDSDLFVRPHERQVGYVPQDVALLPHLSVRQNLEFGLRRVAPSNRRVAFERVVETLGLLELLPRRPDSVSGGEAQRIQIGRALLNSPSLLLMDEPLASLDEQAKREILPFIESLRGELAVPIVYVSHAIDEVARLANWVASIDDGAARTVLPVDQALTGLDSPLSAAERAESVIEARVLDVDAEYGLAHLESPAGRIVVVDTGLSIGMAVRVRIAAKDVSLTLSPATQTSILNVLPATVDDWRIDSPARVTARLRVGSCTVLARLTRKSSERLELKKGLSVFAQVKSVAIVS